MWRGRVVPGNSTALRGNRESRTMHGQPADRHKASLRPYVEPHGPRGPAARAVHLALHRVALVRELECEEERIVALRAVEVQAADRHGAHDAHGGDKDASALSEPVEFPKRD